LGVSELLINQLANQPLVEAKGGHFV